MRPGPIVLDTDVASAILRERLTPWLSDRLSDSEWVVTFPTVGELWKWAEARRWGHPRRAALEGWLRSVAVVDSDDLVARQWGRSAGVAHVRGLPRPTNDAWIAACCVARELPLLTLNVKDFAYHTEHDGLALVD